MLTIQNAVGLKNKEFRINGYEWILYGVQFDSVKYTFTFMPKDSILSVYVISKSVHLMLNRYKDNSGMYKIHRRDNNIEGVVDKHHIGTLEGLIYHIGLNKLLC